MPHGPLGLPGCAYTDADLFDKECNGILRQGWHCLGRLDEVAKPGDYFTTNLLGEPLLVCRGDDDQVRVMANSCRHRNMPVAKGAGNTRLFVCPYHAWSYGRAGTLVKAPFMDIASLEAQHCQLPTLSSTEWNGFVYVCLAEQPLSEPSAEFGALDKELALYNPTDFRIIHSAEEIWACNWKCLVENFMEGYHLSVVHPKTLHGYTPTKLCRKGPSGPGFTSYWANYPNDIESRGQGAPNLPEEHRQASFLYSVFPTQVVSQSATLIASLSLQPLAVDKINVRWTLSTYGEELDSETIEQRIALWTEVNREDREKLEELQAGLGSRYASAGPLAGDDFEGTIADFHGYLEAST